MTTGYKMDPPDRPYFLTFTVVDWIDVFTRQLYRDIVVDSFTYCRQHKGMQVWAYVIMSNHVHCIISVQNSKLSDVVRDFKRHTASKILGLIQSPFESRRDWMMKRFEFAAMSNVRNSDHQFWYHDNHAEVLTTLPFTLQKMNYIHLNPVRAGLVDKPEDWVYSSARNYLGMEGRIEIDLMDISF